MNGIKNLKMLYLRREWQCEAGNVIVSESNEEKQVSGLKNRKTEKKTERRSKLMLV